jgi:hypothetical protein
VKSDIEGKTFEHDPKYLNVRVGMNSRMDTIQAAVLIEKLKIFEDEIDRRNLVADRYARGLSDLVKTPSVIEGGVSVWAQYTIVTEDRDGLAAHLRAEEIPSAVYYPRPAARPPTPSSPAARRTGAAAGSSACRCTPTDADPGPDRHGHPQLREEERLGGPAGDQLRPIASAAAGARTYRTASSGRTSACGMFHREERPSPDG